MPPKPKPKAVVTPAPPPPDHAAESLVPVSCGAFSRILAPTIKTGVDVELRPCTAIVGPSGVGKTAVLDAIRLALTGAHPIGPTAADVRALTCDGDLPTVTLSGPDAEAAIEPEGRGLRHHLDGELALVPVADRARFVPAVGELLRLSGDQLRDAVVARFGDAVGVDLPTPPGLSSDLRALWESMAHATSGSLSERIEQVRVQCRARRGGRPIAAELEAARAELEAARTQRTVAVPLGVSEELRRRRVLASQRCDDTGAAVEQAQRRVGASASADKIRSGLATGERAQCVVCTQPVHPELCGVLGLLPTLSPAAELALAQARAAHVEAQDALIDADRAVVAATAAREQAQRFNAELETRRTKAQKRVDDLAAGKVPVAVPERELERIQTVDDAAVALLVSLTKRAATEATKLLRQYLPARTNAQLAVDAHGRVQWEVVGNDGTMRRAGAASGAEWGALAVAVACAWSHGAPVRVLLLDDPELASFPPPALAAVLDAVRESVEAGDLTQAVVASWRPPADIPSGWHIIEKGA